MKKTIYSINLIGSFFCFLLLAFFSFHSPVYPAVSTSYDTVQKIYIGYYQRPADPAGLIYWAGTLDATGGNLTAVIDAFANSPESRTLYGAISTSNISTVVNDIYNALLARDAEPAGLAYWVGEFNSGRITAANIMLTILNGAQNEDLQSINNKLSAANLFTKTIDPDLDGSNFQVTYAEDDVRASRNFLTLYATSVKVPTQAETTAYILTNIANPGDQILNRTPPSTPSNVSAISENTQAVISWSPVADATSYDIYWSTTSGFTKTSGTKITGAISPYNHAGRVNGDSYYYIVTAVNSFGESLASTQVLATPAAGVSWTTSIIASSSAWGDAGSHTSIAIDLANRVHISYGDYTWQFPRLGYATKSGGSWGISIPLMTTIGWTSIAIDSSNKVYISYGVGYGTSPLEYITNASGTWVTSTIVSGIAANQPSIALDSSDKVHISYCDGDLKYATNASGTLVTSTIDSVGDVSEYNSIALDSSNKAHISYHVAGGNGDLKYATNASGSWVSNTIDSADFVGEYNSIALDSNNKVHISYYDSTHGDLKYATNASGSWVSSTIDRVGFVGTWTAIAVDPGNKVHISYYDSTNADLKYATNASGSWITSTLDNTGVGGHTSIATDSNNKVHISYYANGTLKYATTE